MAEFIDQSFKIETDINGEEILRHLEKAARVCYKSEDKIGEGSAERLLSSLIRLGHESVLEHFSFTVRFICDRGVSHEIVRHRIASYSQESTRYVDYSRPSLVKSDDDSNIHVEAAGEIQFIIPREVKGTNEEAIVMEMCEEAAEAYRKLRRKGVKPENARSVLPTCLKTELVMTANLREWRHFFKMRAARGAHPDIRWLAQSLLEEIKSEIPVVFDDI